VMVRVELSSVFSAEKSHHYDAYLCESSKDECFRKLFSLIQPQIPQLLLGDSAGRNASVVITVQPSDLGKIDADGLEAELLKLARFRHTTTRKLSHSSDFVEELSKFGEFTCTSAEDSNPADGLTQTIITAAIQRYSVERNSKTNELESISFSLSRSFLEALAKKLDRDKKSEPSSV